MNAPSESLSLGWISLDLDEHIDKARCSFEAYLSNPEGENEATKLVETLEYIDLCVAVFNDAGLEVAASFSSELADLVKALESNSVSSKHEAYQAIIGGFNQLLNYLSRIKGSGVDEASSMLVVLNDVRSAAGKPLSLSTDFFQPNSAVIEFNADAITTALKTIDWIGLDDFFTSLKVGLAEINVSPDDHRNALLEMQGAIKNLDWFKSGLLESEAATVADGQADQLVAEMLMAYETIINGALKNANRLPISAGQVISHSLNLLSKAAQGTKVTKTSKKGKAGFSADIWQQTFDELLFCAAITSDNSKSAETLFKKYNLSEAIKIDNINSMLRLGTPDIETVDIVLGGLIDDILVLQNALQMCADADGDISNCGDLHSMAANLQYTMQIVQFYDLSAALAEVVTELETIQASGQANFEQLESVATQLFNIDLVLKKQRSGGGRDDSELTVIDQVKNGLVETRGFLAEIISLVESGNTSQDWHTPLAAIEEKFIEARGAAKFITCDSLESTLQLVDAFFATNIKTPIAQSELVLVSNSCSELNNAVESLETYLEAMKHSNHALVENLINLVIEQLGGNTVSAIDSTSSEHMVSGSQALTTDSEDIVEATAEDNTAAYSEEVLEGEFDEEIIEIFIEEAGEVFEAINENFIHLQEKRSLGDEFAELRRGYHTLKGSGRMAGAEHVGEAAWSIEEMLNRVIDKSIPLNDSVISLLGEANQYLPVLVEYFGRRLVPYAPALDSLVTRAKLLMQDANIAIVIGESLELEENKASVTNQEIETSQTEQDSEIHDASSNELDAVSDNIKEVNVEDPVEQEVQFDFNQIIENNVEDQEASDSIVEEQPETEDLTAELASEGQDLYAIYMEEVDVQFATLDQYLTRVDIEKAAVMPEEAIERAFHTLAGGARIAGIQPIADIMAPAELLTGQIRRHAAIDSTEQALLVRACHWLRAYLSDSQPSNNERLQLIDDFNEQITKEFAISESNGESNFGELQLECSLILEASQFLREWRVLGSVPEQYQAMLDELKNIADTSADVQPVHDLCESMLSVYECCSKRGLHFQAYQVMVQAHIDLANMLDRMAAGQNPQVTSVTNDISNLLDREQALNNELSSRDKVSVSNNTSTATSDVDDEIVAIFIEESQDLIEEIESSVKEWLSNQTDQSYLESLLRPLHTIKGGARMAGLGQIGDLCHDFEALLQAAKIGSEKTNASFFKKVSAHLGDLVGALSDIHADEDSKSDEQSDDQAASKRVAEVVRVPADLLEQLVNLAGETSISRSLMEEQVSEFTHSIDEIDSTVERLKEQLRRLEIETEAQINFRREQVEIEGLEEFDPLEMDRYSQLQQLTKSLVESASDLKDLKGTLRDKTRDVETLLIQQARINTELQEGLMHTRTVPLSRTIVPRLRRTIRQVSGELDKPVTFDVGSADGELDRSVIERMVAPLEHVLRNAIDHGIESPASRKKLGKPEAGAIKLDIGREGGDVVLKIIDDGKGIDVAAVKKKAISLGLIEKSAELSDEEIQQFIFSAGFSTAKKVTQISGRGVGMDVVQSEIRELGGSVELVSQQNVGTTFIFRLPFTVSMNRALLVSAGGESLAVPLDSVEGIVRVSPYELDEYYGEDAVDFMYAGQHYDFRYLGSLINGSQPQYSADMVGALPVLLVRSGERLVAFQVDRLLGSREIVVKSLGPQFSELQGIAGATVLGDGSVVMIADLSGIVKLESSQSTATDQDTNLSGSGNDRVIAMVVDDSVTVRKVTTRLLERQGFDVITAKDGLDAMEKLEEVKPDFMLLDIEMPRLDGFEVVSRVRHDERLADLPVIMITSRTGEKHRDRALALGANEFLGKPYQEQVLFAKINELLPDLIQQQAANE